MIKNNRAFTLIELLVVVLIIGILAAVAVPQYQKAVYRSRYATLKNLVKSLAAAQEVYYLANGQYAGKFIDLDIDMPGGKTADSTDGKYIYDWGHCTFETGEWSAKAMCINKKIDMAYQQYFLHVKGSSLARICIISTTTAAPVQHQICQAETNRSTNSGGGAEAGYFSYRY